MSFAQSTTSRPNDYFYDQSNIPSGAKDYYKQARLSRQQMMKFAVCPVFPSMFSDLQNYPNKKYVIRRMAPPPTYEEKTQVTSSTKISRFALVGSERFKYFHNSPTKSSQESIAVPKLDLGCFFNVDREKEKEERNRILKKRCIKHERVQTIFRETSAQTSPWEPGYVVKDDGDPEILKLDFLKWGAGLPAGVAELERIARMRNKEKWENSILDNSRGGSFENKRDALEVLSRTEWMHRENDIDEIQKLRLQLLENMLNEIHVNATCRNEVRMRSFIDRKIEEKRDKLDKLKKEAQRKKRRLRLQYTGILAKYGQKDVFEEHVNYNSEMYCPLMRNGTNPRYKHETLTKFTSCYSAEYCNVEEYNVLPRYLDASPDIGDIKLDGTRLCIRETKWTLPVLKKLYDELTELRVEKKQHPNLRVCFEVESSVIPTPEITGEDDGSGQMYEAATFLQKIIRGRAAQNKLFMGRERCHELIDELRGNYALLKGDMCKKTRVREKRLEEQLTVTRCMANMKTLKSSLRKLSGSVTGTLLDFLNKDLQRLLRERRAHAMILLVERLRQIREAEEAGRRQKEIRRRKEHDEIFKQVVKVHQETVDLYLQDIITEGMEFSSEEKAREFVQMMTEKVDKEQTEIEENANQMDREEYIAALVHQFVIPEVEKNIVRDRTIKQQKKHLENAHREIYNVMDDIPKQVISIPTSLSESEGKLLESVDENAIRESQVIEQQLVIDDVRAILDDLVDVPYGMSVLKNLLPCTKEIVKEEDDSESGSLNKNLTIDGQDALQEIEGENISVDDSGSVVGHIETAELDVDELPNEEVGNEEEAEENDVDGNHDNNDDDENNDI